MTTYQKMQNMGTYKKWRGLYQDASEVNREIPPLWSIQAAAKEETVDMMLSFFWEEVSGEFPQSWTKTAWYISQMERNVT